MNFQNLSYFIDIVEFGSVSAAAEKNYIAQQSMSNHLKKVESYFGVPLLKRTTPLVLTPAGEEVYQFSKEVLKKKENVERNIRKLTVSSNSFLRIGFEFNGTLPFLPELLMQFSQQPGCANIKIQIVLNCGKNPELLKTVDLLFSQQDPPGNYKSVPLVQDHLVVAVSATLFEQIYGGEAKNMLAKMYREQRIELLKDLPFGDFEESAEQSVPRHLSRDAGLNIVFQTTSSSLMTEMCRSGRFATIVMEGYAKEVYRDFKDILLLPVKDVSSHGVLSLYYRSNMKLTREMKRFIQVTQRMFEHPPVNVLTQNIETESLH